MNAAFNDLSTDILSQADDFAEAFYRCLKGTNFRVDEWNRAVSHIVAIPAIVNGAFACELYLKSMNPKKGEHHLKVLYEGLEEKTKKRISSNVESKLNGAPWFKGFSYHLSRASNTFYQWRYIFEEKHSEGFYGTFINEFIAFFSTFIKELQNECYEKKDYPKKDMDL